MNMASAARQAADPYRDRVLVGIAASRRIVARPAIAGGSHDPLQETIRERLASGALPRITGRAWAGTAQGNHLCACCGQVIRTSGPEYEVRDLPDVYAHVPCFGIWVAESEIAERCQLAS